MTFARRLACGDHPATGQRRARLQQARPDLRVAGGGAQGYRSGGEQRVIVQHVNVNEGGQAIVGDVNHTGKGGGVSEKVEISPMREASFDS
jgi:hypothetical protein